MWEKKHKDYLDIISPFIIYAAFHETTNDDGIIDVPELTKFVNKEFALNLVDSITICILNRNKNYISKVKNPDRYILIADTYNVQGFEQDRLLSKQNYNYFISEMQNFLRNRMHVEVEISKLEEKLKKFISTNFFDLLNIENGVKSYRDNELAAFLSHVIENDTILKDILLDIVKGQMIYEAIYSQRVDKADIKQKFKNLYIYFDTTFIFYMLGYGGDRYREYIKQIISLLAGLGAKLRCFRHTYDEVYGILRSCETALEKGKEKELSNLDWFIEKKLTASDVAMLLASLEDNISKYITITDTPDYSQPIKQIAWERFRNYLNENISYKKEKAMVNDVESIAAIFRLRNTNMSKTLESCNAIFVTTNKKLVKVVRDYQRTYDDMAGYSPCITEYEISNIAWLKTPTKKNEFLDNSLQFAVSVLKEPAPAFWKHFVETVDKYHDNGYITIGNASELKYELYSKRNTMEVIKDDDADITLESINEILEKNKETLFNELTRENKKKDDKLLELKNSELEKVDEDIKKYKIRIKRRCIAIYITSFMLALTLAVCSIADFCSNLTNSPFKFVYIVEIIGVVVSFFVPKLKEIWKIKSTIQRKVNEKSNIREQKSKIAIENKYSISE